MKGEVVFLDYEGSIHYSIMYSKCFCFIFGGCPCMAINNVSSVQHNNGGFLPDIILLTQCHYHRGTRLNTMKIFCICGL